jgi:hypothetical protein
VKPPKAKPKVQTFCHELPQPLDLDGRSVKPPKAKPDVQRKKEHPTLLPVQNNPSNVIANILSKYFKVVLNINVIQILIKLNEKISIACRP